MRYGHFDDQAREYVITRPDTPLPWINYLGSEAFFGLISNTAGGYAFYRDARLRRLTRYRYNNAPLDAGGRYLYLRDDASAGDPAGGDPLGRPYWSPTWMPTRRDLEAYTCRHGLGYTVIGSTYQGIAAETRYLVPLGETLEIWETRITNRRSAPAALSLFATVEFCLWDAWDDATNFQRNYSIGQVEVMDGVIYHKTEYRERRDHFAYFACSEPVAGFDTQREAFLGPYRGWAEPLAVERGQAGNSLAHGWQPIGAHHVRLALQPGETRTVVCLLGYFENPPDDKFDPPGSQTLNKRGVRPVIARYLQPASVEAAFQALRAHWDGLLGRLQVQTPDPHTDRMVNAWNAYQCMVTFNMSRSASYFESGIGRGMGFRDSNQDLLGFVHMIPARARERILDIAATQLPNGGAYHQYQPLTKRGNNDIGSNFNDDPLWLVLGVAAYLKESGDWSILDEPVPFDNQPGTETPLYEHLQRSVQYTLDRLGPHGLPLIGRADWNDCLNLNCFSDTPGQSFQTTTNKDGQVAESVFIAGLFSLAGQELADIAARRGCPNEAARYAAAAEQMAQTTLAHGWDGAWFRRAYDDAGDPVGSRLCAEGQIFIEPQGMCVMAGIGGPAYARQALDSVRERLATPHGVLLQQPAYSRYYLNLGEISSYPPGYKENAGIFCHTNPWIMIAETVAGDGAAAHDYYTRINPSAREAISEVHRCEPYVYAQMIAGRDAATHGEAKNSWLTGTAAWNYVAITQHILGLRPTLDGLRVRPVIPPGWPGFTAVRQFRGAAYHITVERAGPGSSVQLTVDGRALAGDVVPPATGGSRVDVHVRLG
jgi:cellobiose phosphorylase